MKRLVRASIISCSSSTTSTSTSSGSGCRLVIFVISIVVLDMELPVWIEKMFLLLSLPVQHPSSLIEAQQEGK